MPTGSVKVASSLDDGFCEGGFLYNNTTMIDMGAVQQVADAYFRFTSINIPQGASITSAFLRFVSARARTGQTANLKIQGETTQNPTVITNVNDYYARPRTTAVALWSNIPSWALNVAYESADISNVIQEIVNNVNWVAGNAIQLFVQDNGSSLSAVRQAYAYEGSAGYAVELVIVYGEAPTKYSLTISANPTSQGTTNPAPSAYAYDAGVSVPVTAQPYSGYYLQRWILDGDDAGNDLSITVLMNTNHTLQANFAPISTQVNLTIASSPMSGVPVILDGNPLTEPTDVTVPVTQGDHTISVPPEVVT